MALVNEQFLSLPGSYLFSEINRKVVEYKSLHTEASLIRMGIGDVTKPLVKAVTDAMHQAVNEMAAAETFRGYGPEQGYRFLTEKIIEHEFASKGINLSPDEVFVSDGCKSDMGNIGGLFSRDNVIAVTDPVYPVYVDTNVMEGRAGNLLESGQWSNIVYLPCTADNGFVPSLPEKPVDIIYLCFPNNPTGTTLTRTQLKKWVDFALNTGALILFDAAYEAFISEEDVPHSIYEIEGATQCAIEFRSFSKTAGFTGVRCGYTVVPKTVTAFSKTTGNAVLNGMWNRRQTTKFNGVSYITQRAAEAVYSSEGRKQCMENIAYYMENASIIREALKGIGFEVFGGINAPYIWFRTPGKEDSWHFFNRMLTEINVIGTPGVGFGPSGEGYIRLTAFGSKEDTQTAMKRFQSWNY
ncbi:MAG: LL-diaminopimelate aminotransferase [Bacteroidota bacterium]|nr:LL-diaminopimelate aminotransferase [Bacteroidota bacterium]